MKVPTWLSKEHAHVKITHFSMNDECADRRWLSDGYLEDQKGVPLFLMAPFYSLSASRRASATQNFAINRICLRFLEVEENLNRSTHSAHHAVSF